MTIEKEPLPNWTKYLWDYQQIQFPRPRFVELDLSNRCNINCKFCCSRDARQKSQEDMNDQTFSIQIEFAIKNRTSIIFTGGGEPSLHPKFFNYLDLVMACLIKSEIMGFGLVTNGVALESIIGIEKICQYLNDYPRLNAWARVSLNDRKPHPELLRVMEVHPGQVGISIVRYKKDNAAQVQKNLMQISDAGQGGKGRYLAKIVRVTNDAYNNFSNFDPEHCIGRKFSRVIEPNGKVAYCCHARGKNRYPPERCPSHCRWMQLNEEISDLTHRFNPWT